MTEREQFCKAFPAPAGVEWSEDKSDFSLTIAPAESIAELECMARDAIIYGAMFDAWKLAWQAARAIPDTHRVVSVELLEKCTERLIAGAKAFQILQDQFGVKDRIAPGRIACETLSDELRAIIEDKP